MSELPAKKTLERSANPGEIIKAKELIDVLSPAGLSTQARRTYNLLLEAAHNNLSDPHAEHVISMKELRGSDKSNKRIEHALKQLMTTVITVRVHGKTGKAAIDRVQLLGGNTMELDERNGVFRYSFDKRMVAVLAESQIYAQLKKSVIWAFSSKYALALYEVIERRRNMNYVKNEEFTIEAFRNLLDVPVGKYQKFAQLKQSVITPAEAEVNHLCDFSVRFEPIKKGRKIYSIRMHWWAKTDTEQAEARQELTRPSAGRKARRTGNVEQIATYRNDLINSLTPNPVEQTAFDLEEDKIVF